MKKLKNLLPLLLTLSLVITAMVSVSPVAANGTALSVIFSNGSNSSIGEYFPPDEFTVDINVADVTKLYTFDFTLSYSTTTLTASDVVLGSFFPETSVIWKQAIDNDLGYVRYIVSLPLETPRGEGVSGSGTLATILFTVGSERATILDLRKTKLSNGDVQLIPHEVNDGYFNAAGGVVEVALDAAHKFKVNHAAGSGIGHKSTVGVSNLLEAYVINTGTFDANVQVVFKVTDAAFNPVANVKSSIVVLQAGQATTLSVTWTAEEVDVYLLTAYLFYGPYSTDSFSRTLPLSVLATLPE